MRRPRLHLKTIALMLTALATPALADPFYMGGDVSLLPFIESRGARFADAGATLPAEQILVNNGANLFRIRIFVNPVTDPYAPNNYGAIQDLSYDIALAQRLKQSGAKVMLDFHYSDYWADPGKQYKPAAWTSQSLSQLNQTVHDYTRDTLLAFKAAGVMPEMVQVGNEIRPGMLWNSPSMSFSNSGQIDWSASWGTAASWQNLGQLINSGISGVRAAQSAGQHTDVMIHIDNAASFDGDTWFNNLKDPTRGNVSDYDIIGLSYYPSTATNNTLATLKTRLNNLIAHQSQKIMLAEANMRYSTSGGSAATDWASTPAGQAQFLKDLRNLGLAGNGLTDPSRFIGVQWWFPESVTGVPSAPAWSLYNGGATGMWDTGTLSGNQTIRTHGSLPVIDELALVAPTWNVNADGTWSAAGNWINGTPNASQVARFGPNITAPRTVSVSGAQTVGSISFLSNQSYLISGNGTLTLNAPGAGPAAIGVLGGSHTIAAPIVLTDDVELIAAWNNSLALTGTFTATGKTIHKYGSGTVQLENLSASRLDVQFGTLKIREKLAANDPAGTSVLKSLELAVGSKFDLTNNSAVLDYDTPGSQLNDLREHLATGRLISSSVSPTHTTLGYADNSLLELSEFGGQPVDPTRILIQFTYAGDANLDGIVNAIDLGMLAPNWQHPGTWTTGDFDYNGQVDLRDLYLLAINWNAGVPNSSAGLDAFSAAIQSFGLPFDSVPEPTIGVLLAAITLSRPFSRRRA